MNAPVRVELVFPRSGQHVFVEVPQSVARYVDALRADSDVLNTSRTVSDPAGLKAGETIQHAQ